MSDELIRTLAGIIAGITGVAILALILSPKSNTVAVLGASSSAYSNALATALGPVTGYTPSGNGGFSSSSGFGAGFGTNF